MLDLNCPIGGELCPPNYCRHFPSEAMQDLAWDMYQMAGMVDIIKE